MKAQNGRQSCSSSGVNRFSSRALQVWAACAALPTGRRTHDRPLEKKSRESTETAARLLSHPVLDVADEGQHRRWAASGADPRVRQLGIPRLRLRRRALRRGRTRSLRVLRPEAARAWTATAARAPTATWRPTTSSSRPPAPRRGSSCSNGGAGGIRRPTIRCSGRSTPTISGSTATTPATSATFARTVSSGSPSRCRRTSSSSIPRPTRRRPRRSWTCGGAVPTVNDVALTGPDGGNPWPRGPNAFGGYQLDARVTTLQEQALGALTNHAQIQNAPPQRMLDDLSSFQRVLFTNHSCSRAVRRRQGGHDAVAGSRSAARRARAAGQGGVRARLRPVPRRPRTVDAHRRRSFDFTTSSSQCPRPVDTRRRPPASRLRRARRDSPAMRGPTRSRCRFRRRAPTGLLRRRHQDPPDELRSRPRAADGVRRRPARPQDDWDKFDMPGLRGISKTAPYFHNNSAATLEEVVDHYIEFFKRVEANCARRASCRRSRRRTACTSIGRRVRKSARRCWRTCGSCRVLKF